MAGFPNLRARELDLGSGHVAYRRASLIDLHGTYIPNFIKIEETFCGRTDGRTYAQTDGHMRPALSSRLST